MKRLLLLLLLFIGAQTIYGQTISPGPGNNTVCPGIQNNYTASPPPVSGCNTFSWVVTNGTFPGGATTASGSTVSVTWSNTTAQGKLKVTVTCGTESYVKEETYTIRSLKDVIPQNPQVISPLPYCATNSVTLKVDDIKIPNTGVFTSIPQQYAEEYLWTIPTGWTVVGTGQSGSFIDASPIITITPDNGCRGGTASVQGRTCLTSTSGTVTFNLNRSVSHSITFPAGYVGPKCGDITPRTFTVSTSLSCVSSTTWNFPAGWRGPGGELSPINAPGTSITLTPSGTSNGDGTSNDDGTITATINLDCGSLLPISKDLVFTPPNPQISGYYVCSPSNSSIELTDVPGGTTGITWSVTPTTLFQSATSGSGSTASLRAKASVSGFATITYTITGSCPLTKNKTLWIGPPKALNDSGLPISITLQGNTGYDRNPLPCIPHYNYSYAHYLEVSEADFSKIKGRESISWAGSYVSHSLGLNGRGIHFMPNAYTGPMHGSGYVQLMASNTCGTASIVAQGYGACSSFYAVYPNPSSTEINIEQILPSESSAQLNGESKPDQNTNSNFEVLLMNISNVEMLRGNSGNGKLKLDVSNLKKGVYVMHIISKGKREITTIKIE